MSKHTPGPWTARLVDGQEWHIDAKNGDPTLLHSFWHGLAVYGCDDMPEKGSAVAEANARLIAAAPDLLEALRMSRSFVIAEGSDEQVRQINAAIAKATGEKE